MFRCPAKVLCWATTGGTEDAGGHEIFDRRNRSYFGEIDLETTKLRNFIQNPNQKNATMQQTK